MFFIEPSGIADKLLKMEIPKIDPELQYRIYQSLAILVGALVIFFGLKRIFQYLMGRANLPTLAFRPFRLTLRYGVLICASTMILNVWGVRTDALLTVVGTILGLVAIGFVAVWSVLSNVLCTFVLIVFKPFAVGDELEVPADAVSGKVVDLTLIFTTLRSPDGEYIQVPNNMFFQKIFKRKPGRQAVSLEQQLSQEHAVE
jgi:small-conductance mechanosensitive channel